MARLDLEGFDDFLKDLSILDFDRLAPKMVEAGAPVLEKNLKKRSAEHRDSGDMTKSIKATKVSKFSATGYKITVRPTGTDAKGVRNMEKMCYLEYGTEKQTATPVMTPAVLESEEPVAQKMQEVFDQQTKELQV